MPSGAPQKEQKLLPSGTSLEHDGQVIVGRVVYHRCELQSLRLRPRSCSLRLQPRGFPGKGKSGSFCEARGPADSDASRGCF